jgi:serine/threonine-protein kinase
MRLGKYQLLRKLATGGMAEVFLAKTDGPMGFEKLLVIKRILPHLAQDPQFIEMFLGEAKLAAQLNHPNLVQLFDFGEAEGSYFIAMEYIDGPTLRYVLARSRDLQAPISLALAARIVSSAAEGLAYAHDFRDHLTDEPLHLVHRDVSPDNILIGRSGAVKLVDFGIAKARGQSHHTQAGTVKGKVAYMAPEQLRGEPLDRRVDLYALGIVLYELCTGRMPFEATSDASMVRAVLYDPVIPAAQRVPSLSPALQSIIDRLLARDREARYPDCRALHTDLETFIRSTGEATTGFALSRLVAQLAPPAPPTPPLPPGVTASAFAPTSPILLSERVDERAGVAPGAVLEILESDRTMRSEPRRAPGPPVPTMEVRPADHARRTPPPSAFVFPTALDAERDTVAPLRMGLDRMEPRTAADRRAARSRRGPGGVGVLGVLGLFLLLAAAGAYLGLAAAHRTDLLSRVGLPVPGAPANPAPVVAAAPAATTPGPASPASAPGLPVPPVTGSAGSAPHPTTPTPVPPSTGTPVSGEPPATPTSPPAASAPVVASPGPGPIPGAISAGSPPAVAMGGPGAGPPAAGAPSGSRASPSTPSGAEDAPPAPGRGSASSRRASPAPTPVAAEDPRTAGRESDRAKLLGAFAELEAAKESTVRIESTPTLQVRMGGKVMGKTPLPLTVPVSDGPVELELFDPALQVSRSVQLTLKPGDNGVHKVVIPKGTLELKVQDGVAVSIDGKTAGTTPLEPFSLYEGQHTVVLTRGEQPPERRKVRIEGDETEVLEYTFPEAE